VELYGTRKSVSRLPALMDESEVAELRPGGGSSNYPDLDESYDFLFKVSHTAG